MRALLLKEMLILWREGLAVVLLVAVPVTLVDDAVRLATMIAATCALFTSLHSIRSDQETGFERYVLCMPVSRTALALSRYAGPLLLHAAIAVVYLAAGALFRPELIDSLALAMLVTGGFEAICLSFIVPLCCRLGAGRGELAAKISIAAVGVALIAFILLSFVTDTRKETAALVIILLAAASLAVSVPVSVRLYRRRDF